MTLATKLPNGTDVEMISGVSAAIEPSTGGDTTEPGTPGVANVGVAGALRPVVPEKLPGVFENARQFTPRSAAAERAASKKRTSSRTCWEARTERELMIASGANWPATASTVARAMESDTSPVNRTFPLAEVTRTWLPGTVS